MRHLFISFFISLIFILLYLINPNLFAKFDHKFTDSFFNIRGATPVDKHIVIVDVNEKSLESLGQWPWGRDKIATIIENLQEAEVGVIGIDMVFINLDRSKSSNNTAFAKVLGKTPTILGFMFDFDKKFSHTSVEIPVTYIENNKNHESIPLAKGMLSNIPVLQNKAYSSGAINILSDRDGVMRTAPMLTRYKRKLYPSLSFEMVRAAVGEDTVFVDYNKHGVESISFGGIYVPTDKFARVHLNFRGEGFSYTYISAVDVYNNTFNKEKIAKNIVLLGSSAPKLGDTVVTPFDTAIPRVEIHANMIDNIINNDFLRVPSYLLPVNILLIMVSSLLVGFGLKRLRVSFVILFSSAYVFVFVFGVYYLMIHGGIVLNVIYPLLSAFTSLFVLYFTYEERHIK